MLTLIDNDALLKLARYGLLEQALQSLGVGYSDVRVLATAKYVLLPAGNRLRRCKDEGTATRLEEFLSKVGQVDVAQADSNAIDTLAAQPNIDAGEALLFAIAASTPDARLITGDKRALAALSSAEEVTHMCVALTGRVITLEVLFALFIKTDFATTQTSVRANADVDKALTMAFGVSSPASHQSACEALASYISHLKQAIGDLLHPLPD